MTITIVPHEDAIAASPATIARTLSDVLCSVRSEYQRRTAWLSALDRAACFLVTCSWEFDGETLMIDSGTKRGIRYTITAYECTCPAGQKRRQCWHQAARQIIVKAGDMAARRQACDYTNPSDIQADVDELFG